MALQTQTSLSSACTRLSRSPIWPHTKLVPCLQRSSRIPTNFLAFLGIAAAMRMSTFFHEVNKTQAFHLFASISDWFIKFKLLRLSVAPSTFCIGSEYEPDHSSDDWMRIAELQSRNKFCLPHLKSSYPLESRVQTQLAIQKALAATKALAVKKKQLAV